MTATHTQVAIVGGGPAGLMLSHLLHRSGIASVVVDIRTYDDIATTVRAGILEPGSVRMLTETGVSQRVLTDGDRHDGIVLRFNGDNHRIDLKALVDESVWLYPQTEVFIDLAARRESDGGDVRYGVSATAIDMSGGRPVVTGTDADGNPLQINADLVVGADGSHSMCRRSVLEASRTEWFQEYPFAWLGFLIEAPQSHPELIYTNSEHGFALISQRTTDVQRVYLECATTDVVEQWTDDRIWSEIDRRVNGNGFEVNQGPICDKAVLPFRSFVTAPMRHDRLLLAGDAAHTVPPTGAKGLNLALADVRVLHEAIEGYFDGDGEQVLDRYTDLALQRVWKAQHFSYWMTTMLHTPGHGSEFDRERQRAELAMIVGSPHGSAYLADAYTGWQRAR